MSYGWKGLLQLISFRMRCLTGAYSLKEVYFVVGILLEVMYWWIHVFRMAYFTGDVFYLKI